MVATAVKTQPIRRAKRVRPETSVIYAEVCRCAPVTPHIRRVTMRSEEFAGWLSEVPDQFITFIFPKENRKQPAVAKNFSWEDAYREGTDPPHARNYTVRSYRPELKEIDVDMILHGDNGQGSIWAETAEPGDQMAIWGPRIAYDPPPNMDWMLLMADETGLPAIAAIIEHADPSVRIQVVALVQNADEHYPLPERERLAIRLLHREGAGNREDQLLDAIRTIEIPLSVNYAWGGGEFRSMQAIGRLLRRERGFRPSDVTTIGYWSAD